MTEESRKRRDANVDMNCGTCCHSAVCSQKEAYRNIVSAMIHDMQAFPHLIVYDVKCRHHMRSSGVTHDLLFADMEEIIDA